MRKKILPLFLAGILLFLNGSFSYTFAAGTEFLRTRSGSLAAQEATLNAREAAAVEYFISPEDETEIFVWQSLDAAEVPVNEVTAVKQTYRISAGNVIEIFVWHNSDLSKDVIVGPDGEISVPLVGRIQAVGLTAAQLETKVTEAIAQFIKSPQVSVMVKQFDSSKFVGTKNNIIEQFNSMKSFVVGPDGMVSYPYIGRIHAAGLSISQLEKKIAEALSKYVESPQVAIGMKKFAANKIIILGAVSYPGIFPYKGTINLIEAIALAGDFNPKAQRNSVIVVHGNLSANPQIRRVNMDKAITRGATNKEDIGLQPDDVVYVPMTFVGNLIQCLNDIGPLIGTASSAIDLRGKVRNLQGYSR